MAKMLESAIETLNPGFLTRCTLVSTPTDPSPLCQGPHLLLEAQPCASGSPLPTQNAGSHPQGSPQPLPALPVPTFLVGKIHHSNHFKVHSSVVSSSFPLLLNHPHHSSPELCHLPKLKLCPQETLTAHPLPQPLAPPSTSCLCGSDSSRDLLRVGSHRILCLILLCPVYFSERHVLKFHLVVAHAGISFPLRLNNIPPHGWVTFCLSIYLLMDI